MNILPGLLNRVCLYWEKGTIREDGERDFSEVCPVELRCHWTFTKSTMTDADGKQFESSATITLMDAVMPEGILWLSSARPSDAVGTAIAQAPVDLPYNQIIKIVQTHPDLYNTETVYEAAI